MAVNILRDITEHKRIEKSLREMREAERRRIAHDLHDGVLQDLSYTAVSMDLIKRKLQSQVCRKNFKRSSIPSGVLLRT